MVTITGDLGIYYRIGMIRCVYGFTRSSDTPRDCDNSHKFTTIRCSRSDNGQIFQNEGLVVPSGGDLLREGEYGVDSEEGNYGHHTDHR